MGFLPSLSSRKKKEGEGFFARKKKKKKLFLKKRKEEKEEGNVMRSGEALGVHEEENDDDENDDDDDDDENDEKKRLSLEEDLLLSGENGVFHCPITQEIFEHPVTLRCGHTFSKTSLMRWMAKNPCCPTCRKSQFIFDFNEEMRVNKVVENAVEFLTKRMNDKKKNMIRRSKSRSETRVSSGEEEEEGGGGVRGGGENEEENEEKGEKWKRLPLFVLDAVVPGTELMLNVFEPKLRLMVQTVLTQHYNPSFVMCARTYDGSVKRSLRYDINNTTSLEYHRKRNTIARHGIIARIIAASETVDGRFLIRIRADSEKVVVIQKSSVNNRNNNNNEGGGENGEIGGYAGGEVVSEEEEEGTEEEENMREEAFPICDYTERIDAPWSSLTERLAGSADEAKASLLLSVDEAEATFYAWATLAEKSGYFGSHACFAHDDCVSGMEKGHRRTRKGTMKSKRPHALDESAEDERERNLPLKDVVFRWKSSLEDNGELERLNEINNERDYDLAFDGGNASSFRRQQLLTRFKSRGGGGMNNMQRPSFEEVRSRPEQFASTLLWWFVRCVNPIPSAGAALEIRPSMLSTGDAKTRFALFSKLISVSIVRVLGYAPMEWMNWECVKEKRLMKKIGEVLSKERETISAATIRKEEIGKDSANRRKLRILIETCLSIVYEYSKEEKQEERQQQNGGDADGTKNDAEDAKNTSIPTVSGVRIVFTDEELDSFGAHKLALTLRDVLLKVKRKNDRKAQRKRVLNLRALAKALKHNLDENEFFHMFDPFCHDLTATNSNFFYLTTNNVNNRMHRSVTRIRAVAKLRRFLYRAQSFLRGVSFGAKLAYDKFFWIAGLILFSLVIFALIVQSLRFIHRFGPSQEEMKQELQRVQSFVREFANVVFSRTQKMMDA